MSLLTSSAFLLHIYALLMKNNFVFYFLFSKKTLEQGKIWNMLSFFNSNKKYFSN